MAVIVNGDGILTGISSLATSLTDITSGRGTITGVTTVGTLQLGAGVSISSPRSQQAAIFTNNTEFLTVDDAGRVGIAITNPTTKFDVNGTSKFQDDVTFTGANYNVLWDKSDNALEFADNAELRFGASDDFVFEHNGTRNIIKTMNGEINIRYSGQDMIVAKPSGAVELYFNNSKKFETTTDGTNFTGSIHTIGSGNFYPMNDDNVQLGLSNRKWSAIHGVTLNINGGDAEFRGTTPGTTDMTWDQSENALNFDDNVYAHFGTGDDLKIYHDGTDNLLSTVGTVLAVHRGTTNAGNPVFEVRSNHGATNQIKFQVDGDGDVLIPTDTGKLQLGVSQDLNIYHDGSESVIGNNTGTFQFLSPNEIRYRATTHHFLSYGNDETMAKFIDDGAVELYHNNVKKIETATEGVVIPAGGGNCLRVFGQNTAHSTSALIIGQNNSSTSQLRAYGPDSSTNGRIEFRSSRSDASNTVNLIYDSGNLEFASGNGISFAATGDSSGSMSNELLDDYEEGDFTPTSNGTLAHGTGFYTKIGRQVTIHLRVIFGSSSSGTVAQILSLPFTPAQPSSSSNGAVPAGFGYISSSSNLTGAPQVHLIHNESKIVFYNFSNGLTLGNLSGKEFRFGVIYQAS